MKAYKIFLIVSLVVAATASFNSVTAQTLNDDVQSNINPKQQLIVNILKQEIQSNKSFADDADAIKAALSYASMYDMVAPDDCYKYTPLLVNALNSNALLSNYYNIQGNYGYSFITVENNKPVVTTYNFYENTDEAGNPRGLSPSVTIRKYNALQKLESAQAEDYIKNNFCVPLNQILDQNGNLPIPQLLNILHQRFSR